MITRIDLQRFKCFELLKLPLQPLTILSGGNASGKSSVMQALVLLHQTIREHEWSSRLMLNGTAVRLGTAADVIDQIYGRYTCGIGLFDTDGSRVGWTFRAERNEMSMLVQDTRGETATGEEWNYDGSRPLHYLLPDQFAECSLAGRLRDLTYLTAERLGPREQYPFDDPQLTPVVGPRGEHTVSVLHTGRDLHILDELAVQDVPSTRLRQTEAWMGWFFPGCVLAIEEIPRTNALTLGIRTSSGTSLNRPVNTGFGLTQVLPIIVAALSARENALLLIENPEVHLHPAAQGKMGEFLAQVASAGIQVVVETHSDHILNGIRRAVKTDRLSCKKVALHFFRPREDANATGSQVESPEIDADGNIDSWPDGFFDQFDRDMNFLAGWS